MNFLVMTGLGIVCLAAVNIAAYKYMGIFGLVVSGGSYELLQYLAPYFKENIGKFL